MRIVRDRPTVHRFDRPRLALAAWLVVAVLGVSMATQVVGWSGWRSVAILQTLTPYTTMLLAPLAVLAWRHRRPAMASTASLIGLGGLALAAPVVFPTAPVAPASDASGVRIVSVNLLYTNDRIGLAGDRLLELDADVVVFHEYTAAHRDALLAHPLADTYPARLDRDGFFAGGTAVWSRLPIREDRVVDMVNFSLDVVVETEDGDLRLFAVHPPTPVFNSDGWLTDLDTIREVAASETPPHVIVGDFNATWWHPPFRDLLDEGYVAAHIAQRDGWSASWPTDTWLPAFARLDHALVGRGWTPTDVDDVDVPGSDHRGFVVTVAPAR